MSLLLPQIDTRVSKPEISYGFVWNRVIDYLLDEVPSKEEKLLGIQYICEAVFEF